MADRWFVVPTTTDSEGVTVPKYSDQVDSFSGNIYDFSQIDDPAGWTDEMYVVRFYAASSTVDSIESQSDAHTLGEYNISGSEAASWLNQTFELNRTWDEWQNYFLTG